MRYWAIVKNNKIRKYNGLFMPLMFENKKTAYNYLEDCSDSCEIKRVEVKILNSKK